MRRRPLTVALAVAIAAATSLTAHARADTGGLTITANTTADEFPPPSTGGTLPQIQGRVTDASGAGLPGVQVSLAFTDHDHPSAAGDGTTVTAADGSYALQPSVPEAQADGQLESRTYTATAGGVTSAPVHIGEPGTFSQLINSGGYATPGNPYWAIAGQVSGPVGSAILGQKLTASGWHNVSETRSYASGTSGVNRFSLVFPGLKSGSQTVRAVRLGDSFQDEGDSPTATVSYSWSHLAGNRSRAAFAYHTVTNTPVRYSPCTPITWAINLDGAPAGALRLVQQAFVQAGYYSGYHFTYVGTTRERPSSHDADVRSATQKGPDILLKWVRANGETDLARNLKNVAGVGGSILQHLPAGKFRLGGGSLLLIQKPGGQDLPMDFSPYGWGPEILHEIGSVMGLRNVPDQSEIMSIKVGTATRYGAGDVAGLAKLGKTPGCATS